MKLAIQVGLWLVCASPVFAQGTLVVVPNDLASVNDNYRLNGTPVQAHDTLAKRVFDDTPRRIEDALCLSLI